MKIQEKQKDILSLLRKYEGNYRGFGYNHENRKFRGRLNIKPIVSNMGIYIHYTAIGTEGANLNKPTTLYTKETAIYNEEHITIALDHENNLKLWSLNSNIGTMIIFDFRGMKYITNQKKHIVIFGYGTIEDNTMFREEITIELWDNGEIGYSYTWGESKGLFLSRSFITMKKT